MKSFRFRLQRIMELREQIRDEARQELVRRNAERDHEISVLAYLDQEYQQTALIEGGMYSASEVVVRGDYGERLASAIVQQKIVVAEAVQRAEDAQARYIEASKEAKAIEMLKDKKLVEFKEQMLREEGAFLDELAVQRTFRKEQ